MISKIVLFCLLPVCGLAEDITYNVFGIAEVAKTTMIKDDQRIRRDSPTRLEVKINVSRDVSSKDVIVKAYFYDINKKLIHAYEKPAQVGGLDDVYRWNGMPEVLKKGRTTDVYFALPPEIMKSHPNAIFIVFGDQKTVCVKAKGAANPMDYDFPEKSRVIASKK